MSNEDIAKSMGDMASSVKEYRESILRYLEDPKIDLLFQSSSTGIIPLTSLTVLYIKCIR